MKHVILISLFLAASLTANAQQDTTTYVYCQIEVIQGMNKFKVAYDFGQEYFWNSERIIRDETGKEQKFNSVVDVINYMISKRWYYVDQYSINLLGSPQLFFLFRRKKF